MILGKMMEAKDEVCEDAEVVCSVSIVVWYAMQELRSWSVSRQSPDSNGMNILEEWRGRRR